MSSSSTVHVTSSTPSSSSELEISAENGDCVTFTVDCVSVDRAVVVFVPEVDVTAAVLGREVDASVSAALGGIWVTFVVITGVRVAATSAINETIAGCSLKPDCIVETIPTVLGFVDGEFVGRVCATVEVGLPAVDVKLEMGRDAVLEGLAAILVGFPSVVAVGLAATVDV